MALLPERQRSVRETEEKMCYSSSVSSLRVPSSGNNRASLVRIIDFILSSSRPPIGERASVSVAEQRLATQDRAFYQFLKSKKEEEEEEEQRFRRKALDLNLNLTLAESDIAGVRFQGSNCSGIREEEKGLWDLADQLQCSAANNNCNSCVESENVSVFQKSSEGENDPKNNDFNNVSETANSDHCAVHDVSGIDLNNKNSGPLTETRKESCLKAEVESIPTESRKEVFEEKDGSVEQGNPPANMTEQGGLDLLVDAITLATGGMFASPSDNKKRKRVSNGNTSSCKKPKGSSVSSGQEKDTEKDDGSESETISEKPKHVENNIIDWYADIVDTSPLVRSKRGRNQALPLRFRDSVLEPWKRIPRSRSKPIT
eukprot:TRINITY_DN17619_c0_g1_i1.p1 TRINITY_DN17619_c0_g1~~TRINITY_DN17619_c0_g1_i1.p1  ORF type:complete len:372 (+),score=79.39 TRINITY_DN17619_c0_g1_i1:280-1395(+)